MDRSDIVAMLKPIGLNVVYAWYKQGQMPKRPYMVVHYLNNHDFAADNGNYLPRQRWQVDLITTERDEALERKVEAALRDQGFFYSKTQIEEAEADYIATHYRFETL